MMSIYASKLLHLSKNYDYDYSENYGVLSVARK